MTRLAATAVTAAYGPRVVLRECSFAMDSGEIVAIVGPNGAGKSTLLRVLAGLLRPTAGAVALDGEDLTSFSRAALARRIAVVPQIFDTLFPFTVREVVGLGRTARLGAFGRATADDVAAVDRAIADLELTSLALRRIDRLSGGERQRAVLAMALAQETAVLLLDEPTVHLDPKHQLATLELLRDLATRRRLAVCAVLHDLNLASAFASRIVAIADGRVVREGTPVEVFSADLVQTVFGEGLEVIARDGRPGILPRVPTRESSGPTVPRSS
jgi:ABC-type cobalamin/Fe3+-siderophores transport system ATPase subunit